MEFKKGLILVALIVGCTALPTPEQDDISMFFNELDPSSRIMGGVDAPFGSHPHMVGLSNGALIRSYLCGGSVIARRSILTAAHCINAVFSFGSLSNSLRATVGTNRWNSGGQTYNLARNASHPNYVVATTRNDIGILFTTRDIQFSALVQIIPLSYDFVGAGVSAKVAGWGRIRANGNYATNLLEITTFTIDGERCVREAAAAAIEFNVRAPPVEPHIEVCTFHSAGHGTCQGDSGSALVRTDRGQQIGVVSWGFACARGAPDMFVRISAFQNWIAQHIL